MFPATSTGILRIASRFERCSLGNRRVMSKLRSPSIIWLKGFPPTAVSPTACTSPTLRFHRAHLRRSMGSTRFDWPMIR